ncbi:MAG TPA: signal peptide peptidase SppA [Chloroflexota bacterium]
MSRALYVLLGLVAFGLVASVSLALGYALGRGLLAIPQPAVALLRVEGTIAARDSGGFLAGEVASAERIVEQLDRIREDPGIRAVVLRIDSPGGEVTASDEIHAAVQRVREADKAVVVSMGGLAASGGLYIATPADYIVANPTTITGSIGVIATYPNVEGLMDKVGIRWRIFKTGPHKAETSGLEPISPEGEAIIRRMMDEAYERFIDVVAEGRGLPEDRVRALADGRVYTGLQARDVGLVDDLGNLPDAIRHAGELAGLGSEPRVIEFDVRPGLFDALRFEERLGVSIDLGDLGGIPPRLTLQYLYLGTGL